jgi:SAM-dependent methyltransferase
MNRQDQVNQSCYRANRVATTYLRSNLQVPEVLIYVKYSDEIRGSRVLDIGCGAGRTAVFISRWAGTYTAIDYVERMVELCRERCPGVDCTISDVRDMSRFENGSFDAVFFSNNGLDSLVHDDRVQGFREMHRVLREGGLLVFSTHNRDYPGAERGPVFRVSLDPGATLKRLVRYIRCQRNRKRNRQFERTADQYRIINDPAHNYGLVTYYISVRDQVAQLRSLGLELIEAYDLVGNVLDPDAENTTSPWIWYVARKV